MHIEHASHSRVETYHQCPWKYKLKYHDKVVLTDPEPFYFTYGKIIHKIAEEFVGKKQEIPISEIASDVIEGRIFLERDAHKVVKAPPLPASYKKRLPNDVKRILELTNKLGCEGHTEWAFKYDLELPKNKLLVGFIDRIIPNGDKWIVVDYKTTQEGPWRKTAKNVKADAQLKIYARIVQKTFNVPGENIVTGLYYITDGKMVGVNGYSDKELEKIEQKMLNSYNEIASADPDKIQGVLGDHCKRCEFKEKCCFYRNSKYAKMLPWD